MRRALPTVVVVREPIAVLASYLTYAQHGRPAGVLKEYISYYRELIPYVDQVVVCDFEEIDSDMASLVARINRRFSMDIPAFDDSKENVDHVFNEVARQHVLLHPQLDPYRVAAQADRRTPRGQCALTGLNCSIPETTHFAPKRRGSTSSSLANQQNREPSSRRCGQIEPLLPPQSRCPVQSVVAEDELRRSNG